MLLRHYWGDYMIRKDTVYQSLEEYTVYRVKKDLNLTLDQAIEQKMAETKKNLIPYDKARFGELPEVLRGLE